jgi:predicted anti-sigma-YlaC factor YlaD
MMGTCNAFDKYRDGELTASEAGEFESHLAACEDCRAKMSLLNNLVHVLRQEESRPLDLADRIARQAFRRGNSWDSLVVSWLRPGPSLAALAIVVMLFSFLWLMPGGEPVNSYSEYEGLMDEADTINLGPSGTQVHSDSELVMWLETEGNSQ